MGLLLLGYLVSTIIGLNKARGTYEVSLVLLPTTLILIAYGVAPLLNEPIDILVKVLCLLFAAGLPMVAVAHINTRRERDGAATLQTARQQK